VITLYHAVLTKQNLLLVFSNCGTRKTHFDRWQESQRRHRATASLHHPRPCKSPGTGLGSMSSTSFETVSRVWPQTLGVPLGMDGVKADVRGPLRTIMCETTHWSAICAFSCIIRASINLGSTSALSASLSSRCRRRHRTRESEQEGGVPVKTDHGSPKQYVQHPGP